MGHTFTGFIICLLVTEKNLLVDNVNCCAWLFVGFPHHSEPEIVWRADPGAGYIQLAMGKHLSTQPNPCVLQSLPLRLVYGNGEGRPHWELAALPLEGVLIWLWDECDSGNEDYSACLHCQ